MECTEFCDSFLCIKFWWFAFMLSCVINQFNVLSSVREFGEMGLFKTSFVGCEEFWPELWPDVFWLDVLCVGFVCDGLAVDIAWGVQGGFQECQIQGLNCRARASTGSFWEIFEKNRNSTAFLWFFGFSMKNFSIEIILGLKSKKKRNFWSFLPFSWHFCNTTL